MTEIRRCRNPLFASRSWLLLSAAAAARSRSSPLGQRRAAFVFAFNHANICAGRERQDPALRSQRSGARVSRLQGARCGKVLRRPQGRAQLRRAELRAARANRSGRTFVERLHDFKAHLWFLIRHFFRGQFTDDARDNFREQQAKLGKRSQVVGAAQFAQIPLLNASQLVARWKLETPPALVSETQQLPIDGLSAGVYLIEATDGTYKAYTVAIVTSVAVVERTEGARADLYVADRKSGAPIAAADVVLWANGQLQSSGKTGSDGMASLTMTIRGGAQGAEPENVWILARQRSRRRAGHALGLQLSEQ